MIPIISKGLLLFKISQKTFMLMELNLILTLLSIYKYYRHKLEELFFKYGDDARIMLPDYTFVSIEVDIL